MLFFDKDRNINEFCKSKIKFFVIESFFSQFAFRSLRNFSNFASCEIYFFGEQAKTDEQYIFVYQTPFLSKYASHTARYREYGTIFSILLC